MCVSNAEWHNANADQMFGYAQEHWGGFGVTLTSLHQSHNPVGLLNRADSIVVTGGSVHTLLRYLQTTDLLEAIRERVNEGVLYVGTSAGTILTGPTIRTTMENPVLPLENRRGLGVLPFGILCHYYEYSPEQWGDRHHSGVPPVGRARNMIAFGRKYDPEGAEPIIAIKDGSALRVVGRDIRLMGNRSATIFGLDKSERKVRGDDGREDLSMLLDERSELYRI